MKPGRRWRVLAWRGPSRIELRDEGTFDELVVDDWLHIEQMTNRTWWMRIGPPGQHLTVWVTVRKDGRTRITITEDETTP